MHSEDHTVYNHIYNHMNVDPLCVRMYACVRLCLCFLASLYVLRVREKESRQHILIYEISILTCISFETYASIYIFSQCIYENWEWVYFMYLPFSEVVYLYVERKCNRIYMCVRICKYIDTHRYKDTHKHVSVYMYIYVCVCICMNKYVYIYIHTYLYTNTYI